MRAVLKITTFRRLVSLLILTFFTLFTTSCTHIAYSGPELPDSEIALIKGYYRYYILFDEDCTFGSFDGHPLSVIYTIKATPGRHWMEIIIVYGSYHPLSRMCAFDLDVKAGLKYQIKPHSLKKDESAPLYADSSLYAGSLDIEVTMPGGGKEMQIVKTTCHLGARLCRKKSDCGAKLDRRCIPQKGYDFGQCEF